MSSLMTTMTNAMNDLPNQLAHLGLHAMAAGCDDFIARATKGRWSPRTMLEEMARCEMTERARDTGANAVIGIDLDYETVGQNGSMLMVTASGTAVVVT